MKRHGIADAGALIALLAGAAGLLGWALGWDLLKSVSPGAVQMKPNAGVGLVLGGLSLLLSAGGRFAKVQYSHAFALVVVVLSASTLAQYLTGASFGIDELLFLDLAEAFSPAPGRMSPLTAWALLMCGTALAARLCVWAAWSSVLAVTAALQVVAIGCVTLVGYAWNTGNWVAEAWLPPVALHTAVGLVALGCGILARQAGLAATQGQPTLSSTEKGSFVAFWTMVPVLAVAAGFSYDANVDYVRAAWSAAHAQKVRVELAGLETCLVRFEALQRRAAAPAATPADPAAQAATCAAMVDTLSRLVEKDPVQAVHVHVLERSVPELLTALQSETARLPAPAASGLPAGSVAGAMAALDRSAQSRLALLEKAESPGRFRMLVSWLAIVFALIGIFGMLVRGMGVEIRRSARLREGMAVQEAVLRDVINSIPDVIAYTDAHGTYLGCNLAYAESVGVPVSEIVGREAVELTADPAPAAAPVPAASGDAHDRLVDERWVTYPDGSRILFEMVRSAWRGPDGQAAGLLLIGRNITQRKQVEEEVTRARLLAEQATRVKSEFLANMSHEIRTPMTGVLGMVDLLAAEDLTPDQNRYVHAIRTSGRHLLSVLNDILDFSRFESGNFEIERIDFDLDDVLQQLRSLANPLAVERRVGLHFQRPGDATPALRGDPQRLLQVLLNLVSNAIKFTPQGSIMVAVTSLPSTGASLWIRFEVRDTGLGIAPEVLEQLFSPFKQADSSTARRFGGSGLGLAICKRLVEAMGGGIKASSEVGVGSRFAFELPFEAGDAHAVVPTAEAAVPSGARHRILIAEDVEINRDILRAALGRQGHHLVFAFDGAEAVARVQSETFDLVLMDVQMPVMDGEEATRRIRRLPGPERLLPIIGLTANVMARQRESYLGAGMDACLNKPIDWNELAEAMQRLTGEGRPRVQDDPAPHDANEPTFTFIDTAVVAGLERVMGPVPTRTLVLDGIRAFRSYCDALAPAAGAEMDAAQARASAHKLKGSAGTLGLRAVAAAAQRMEMALLRSEEASGFLDEIRAAIDASVEELLRLRVMQAPGNGTVA